MVVGTDGLPPLPWLAQPVADTLARQRGHALLLHGAAGNGTLAFGLTLAQGWLCEAAADVATRPCGRCPSCRLVQSQLHPDLHVLLPQDQRRSSGWLLADDKPDADDKKKPSRQIRIGEVRALIDWSHRTPARGATKVALLHPAEHINPQAANALLKTLEEPPAGTRLLLTAADPALLLPTVLSRCQRVPLPPPAADAAAQWLAAQGVAAGADVLLAACAGRPLDAQALAAAGIDAAAWAALPAAVARGQGGALASLSVPQRLDALLKLCHDALARAVGGSPRYFPAAGVPARADIGALLAWRQTLLRTAVDAEHPWHEGLLLDALLGQAQGAFTLTR